MQKPSLPISHFSFRSASALIFATRRKKKTNSRARSRVRARETETIDVVPYSHGISKDEFNRVPLLDIFYVLFVVFSKEVRSCVREFFLSSLPRALQKKISRGSSPSQIAGAQMSQSSPSRRKITVIYFNDQTTRKRQSRHTHELSVRAESTLSF